MKESLTTEIQAPSAVIEVKEKDFASVVLESELPVLVDFSSEWCPPCRVLEPIYARLSGEYQGKVLFASVSVEENPVYIASLGVQGTPTLILFHRGQEVTRLVGPHPGRLPATIARELAHYGLL